MSAASDISDEVRGFIARYIDSVERLEVLLLVQRHPQRTWTSSSVASELRIGASSVDRHLAKLCAFNLLEARVGKDLFYRYNPRLPHLERAARALADAYAEHRLAVIQLIVAGPAGPVRDFAEAFRLSKKDDSDA